MFTRASAFGILIFTSACFTSNPGAIRHSPEDPLVSIGAGIIDFGPGRNEGAWYLVDRKTQTCWFANVSALAPIDCCAVHRVPEARTYITWASCPAETPAQAQDPATPATRQRVVQL